jgi:hypothetical protein
VKVALTVEVDIAMLDPKLDVIDDAALRKCMIASAAEAVASVLAKADRAGFVHMMASVTTLRVLAVESEVGPARLSTESVPAADARLMTQEEFGAVVRAVRDDPPTEET